MMTPAANTVLRQLYAAAGRDTVHAEADALGMLDESRCQISGDASQWSELQARLTMRPTELAAFYAARREEAIA